MADELDDNFFSDEPAGIDETDSIFDDPDDLDEIIIENESSPSSRPFLLSLLGLVAIGVGAFLCLGVYSFFFQPAEPTPSPEVIAQQTQVAEIVITNDAVATENSYVTQTLEAREANASGTATAIANLPTETPVPVDTPIPTETPSPIAQKANNGEDGNGDTEGAQAVDDDPEEDSAVADSERTTSENVDGSTEDNSSASSASGNTDSSNSGTAADTEGNTASSPERLPETGFSILTTLALAMGLLIMLFGARRLRQPQ